MKCWKLKTHQSLKAKQPILKLIRIHILLFFISFYSQTQENYFQQEVNYQISVQLDDINHFLRGHEKVQYINRSDSTLQFIYFHLWPNAYKHPNTALGKQLFSNQNFIMHHLKPEDFGYIDSLAFAAFGKSLNVLPHPEWEDVIKVMLPYPLLPNDTIEISTPFRVKIPTEGVSRMGHKGQTYHITQWYPKPAVFDHKGWHPMPYLDQGEFYSEFGTYDVYITLPDNYLVASTGVLLEPNEEVDFVNERIRKSIRFVYNDSLLYDPDSIIPSSPKQKTLHYRQFRVHDFAWFADKKFYVLHDVVTLPESGREVDTWAYFYSYDKYLWKNAIDYLNRALLFYSQQVGEYPYNQISVVSGKNPSAGGMEYPNIALISPASSPLQLDLVIAHEAGHNWFYGILASNERDYPAMDEGINSFYESKYIETYYPESSLEDILGLGLPAFMDVHHIHSSRAHYFSYLLSARNNFDQPISTSSPLFSSLNYGAIVYSKTAQIFKMIQEMMGEENFTTAMKFYFDKYKFTHPTPTSLIRTLRYFSGNELQWFLDYHIRSTKKTNLALVSVRKQLDQSYALLIKNKTATPVPYSVSAFRKDGVIIGTVWMNATERRKDTVYFPPCNADFFVLDAGFNLPELYRYDNVIYPNKKIFKRKRPIEFRFLSTLSNERKQQVYFFPWFGFNQHDGFMPGMLLHNYSLLPKPLEWFMAPAFGLRSLHPSGLANIQYSWYPQGITRILRLGLNVKKFSLNGAQIIPSKSFYMRNSLDIYWEKKPRDYTKKNIFSTELSILHLFDHNNAWIAQRFKDTHRFMLKTSVKYENTHRWSPFYLCWNQVANMQFLRNSIEYFHAYPLNERFHFTLRAFAGILFGDDTWNVRNYGFFLPGYTGPRDFLYEGYFLGRQDIGNNWTSQQFMERDGAMKIYSALGNYSRSMWSISLESPSFGKLPLHAYWEVGSAEKKTLNKEQVLWDAGLAVKLKSIGLNIYLPLVYSNDIQENLELNGIGFWQTLRFSLNWEELRFRRIINQVITE